MKVEIEVKNAENVIKKLSRLPPDAKQAMSRGLVIAGHLVEADAKRLCPVDTGRLRSSITTEKIDWDEVHIGTNVVYGPYIEYGTGPHDIVPVFAKALHFNKTFAKIVHHPGTREQPFLRPALHQNASKIRNIIISEIQKVLPK